MTNHCNNLIKLIPLSFAILLIIGCKKDPDITLLPPKPTVLSAPSDLDASTISASQINLQWTDNANNESGFKIERAPGGNDNFSQIASVSANVKTYNNTGLSESTSYKYRVRAYNQSGNSAYSNAITVSTSGGTTPTLTAPSDLSASAVSVSQINLQWTDNANNESGFKIERATGGTNNFSQIATVSANVKTYNNTGLSESTSYKYRVRAYNQSGNSDYSNTVTASTSVGTAPTPVAPSGLVASAFSASIINLHWTDNANNESGFKIERAPGGTNNFSQIASVGANVYTFSNAGLNSSTSYKYRVRAYNQSGDSDYSNTATASTSPTPIATLRIINNTKYPMISVQLNNQEYVGTGNGIPIGDYYDIEFNSAGSVSYFLGVGFWSGSTQNIYFTLSGATNVTIGNVTTITFNNPTIGQLLAGFSSSRNWDGIYYDSNATPHMARYKFTSSGSWTFYDDGTSIGSGTVSLVSWPNYANNISFKLCNSCSPIYLNYPFGSFYNENGPPSWPIIEYVAQ